MPVESVTWADATSGPLAVLATIFAGIILITYAYAAIYDKKRVPGPLFSLPVFGDSVWLATTDPAKFLFSRFKRYGSLFRLEMLGFRACVIADADALRPLLNDDGATTEVPVPTYKALMGPYSILSRKHLHAAWRKGYASAVMGKGLQELVPGVVQVMQRNVERWEAAGRMELFSDARRLGLDLALDVLVGFDLTGKMDMLWLREQAAVWLAGMYSIPVNLPGTPLYRALAAKERLLAGLMPAIKQDHEAFSAEWEACGSSIEGFLSKYQEAGRPTTVAQATLLGFRAAGFDSLRDTAMSILHSLMGAADTTRFALFNTWSLLAILPDVQDKIYEEQKKVIEQHGPELTYKAQQAMPYLEATFKECMRFFPASPGSIRKLTRDLQVGDVTVPSGTYMWFVAQLFAMIDPVLWDGDTSAEVPAHMDWRNNLEAAFKPERWLSEETRPRYYFAFGGGTHLCVGVNLVYAEIKLLLAMILRRFRLQAEVPDMLKRCTSYFPYTVPAKGTDGVRLVPREQPLP